MDNFPMIYDCIDVDVLQEIQDRFSEATGLAAVTVDYMGKPVTKYSKFTRFCTLLRRRKECLEGCLQSDAHGGIEAARSGRPYIYKCHTGLVDFAIPIIVRGQYLGAILAGQTKIENNRNGTLNYIMGGNSSQWKEDDDLVKAHNEIGVISYDKMIAAADMMFVISNYIAEKGLMHLIQEELAKKNLELMEEMNIREDLEKSLKDSEIKSLQSQINPHFFFNVLNTIARLALMENAHTTQEIVFSFSELLRYTLKKNSTHLGYLNEEIQYIENYLKIQSIRFGNKLKYKIQVDDGLKNVMIPFMILQPIVENAINHGIEKKKEDGTIEIQVYKLNDKLVMKIRDDGIGVSKEKAKNILDGNNKHDHDSLSTGIGISNIKKRLDYYFGDEYRFDICSGLNEGTTVKIQLPINMNLEGLYI